MTIISVRMDTDDGLSLPTRSLGPLIFWSYYLQSAEFFKGTFPENSNIFQTNWKTSKSSLPKVVWLLLVRMDTYDNFFMNNTIFFSDNCFEFILKFIFKLLIFFTSVLLYNIYDKSNIKNIAKKYCIIHKNYNFVCLKIYDNLLLNTQSCKNQSEEFVKGTAPKNFNIFETNWNTYIYLLFQILYDNRTY